MRSETTHTTHKEKENKLFPSSSLVIAAGAGPHIRIEDLKSYVHQAEEGGYWAEVPALPGCMTQGETLDEVVGNLNDAVESWLSVQTLDSLRANGVQFTIVPDLEIGPLPHVRLLEFAA